MATLGSPSGADDLAAASVLAWALLPGACALAHRLRGLSPRIDEVVAAQLWLEIRSFPWHRLQSGCAFSPTPALRCCGNAAHAAKRSEPTRHGPILAWSIRPPASGIDTQQARRRPVGRRRTLLDSGRAARVITDADKRLLLWLVEAAGRCGTTRTGRGNAGLMSNTASAQVAIQAGLSPITVRRRARRIIDALAAAHADLQAAA